MDNLRLRQKPLKSSITTHVNFGISYFLYFDSKLYAYIYYMSIAATIYSPSTKY